MGHCGLSVRMGRLMNETQEQPTEPTLVLNTESVEYNIVGADAIDSNRPGTLVIDTDKSSPKKIDRKSTRLNSSHMSESRMPSSA